MTNEVTDRNLWCPEHRIYFIDGEGCETCNYEDTGAHAEELEGVPVVYCGDCLVPLAECAHAGDYESEGKR